MTPYSLARRVLDAVLAGEDMRVPWDSDLYAVWLDMLDDPHDQHERRAALEALEHVTFMDEEQVNQATAEDIHQGILDTRWECFDVYTGDLVKWLADDVRRLGEVDEALDELGWVCGSSIANLIMYAQQRVAEHVAMNVAEALIEHSEEPFDPYRDATEDEEVE